MESVEIVAFEKSDCCRNLAFSRNVGGRKYVRTGTSCSVIPSLHGIANEVGILFLQQKEPTDVEKNLVVKAGIDTSTKERKPPELSCIDRGSTLFYFEKRVSSICLEVVGPGVGNGVELSMGYALSTVGFAGGMRSH
ncbi:hypothetical protein CEXT_239331 [Caerostris extrusa]|uniref:Uncharacterized protein n=1 Tax=Caerostris extrusa TaxID=172846 RepID=A0AAV4QWG3_CAEEX|nr:hypothetical protein CEXT_239331 [Caerostris extrusa]